jgi:non-canonical (house-cleaning) NTP pyrophosphatase
VSTNYAENRQGKEMEVLLGSTSKIKQDAVLAALTTLNIEAEFSAVKAESGVAEQPFGDETIQGALNRAKHANELSPNADLVIAIESGIFRENGKYFDYAIVLALEPITGKTFQVKSEAVEFPEDAVLETISRGVNEWTCGKVLAEWGRVVAHDDPHQSLAGKARAEFLNDAVLKLFKLLPKTST